jgi:hypothetical protein
MRWLAIASSVILIAACFFPWITIDSKNIVVSGIDATGTSFGKPGYMHLLLGVIAIGLLFVKKILAVRICIFLTAFNAAWAIRNFIVLAVCEGGVCPQKQTALFVVLVSSFALMICNFFIPVNVVAQQDENPAGQNTGG